MMTTIAKLRELYHECDRSQNAALEAYLSEGRKGFDALKQIAMEKHSVYMAAYAERYRT